MNADDVDGKARIVDNDREMIVDGREMVGDRGG